MREIERRGPRPRSGSTASPHNDVKTYPNNIAIVEAVDRGEIDMGLVNHYYLYELKARGSRALGAEQLLPRRRPRSLILTTTVGVLDTANDKDKAEQFVEFLLSKQAQEYFAEETFEYPLADGVPPAVRHAAARLDPVAAASTSSSSAAGSSRRAS